MPVYDYDCAACGRRIEVVHGVHAPGPTHCPNCGDGPLRKAITAAAVHYKGSGWAKKERRATAAAGTSKDATDTAATAGGEVKASNEPTASSKGEGDADGESHRGHAVDRDVRDRNGGREGGVQGDGERPAAASKSTTAATATKTD